MRLGRFVLPSVAAASPLALALACSDARPPIISNPIPNPTTTSTSDAAAPVDAATDAPVVVTSLGSVQNANDLHVSGSFVYLAAGNGGGATGSIVRFPISGGPPEDIVTKLTEPARVITAGTSVLYTTARANDGLGVLALFSYADAGAFDLATTSYARAITADTQFVYATDSTVTLHVVRRSIAGGAGPVDLATSTSVGQGVGLVVTTTDVFVAATDAFVYEASSAGGPLAIAAGPFDGPCAAMVAHGTDLFVTIDAASPKGAVLRIPQSGGAPSVFAAGLDHPSRLVIDDARVYWSSPTQGTVSYANLDSSHVAQTFLSGLDGPGALALDAKNLYVATKSQVIRTPKL